MKSILIILTMLLATTQVFAEEFTITTDHTFWDIVTFETDDDRQGKGPIIDITFDSEGEISYTILVDITTRHAEAGITSADVISYIPASHYTGACNGLVDADTGACQSFESEHNYNTHYSMVVFNTCPNLRFAFVRDDALVIQTLSLETANISAINDLNKYCYVPTINGEK